MLKRYSTSNLDDPYSLVKPFFRGQKITKEDYQNYVDTLPLESNAKEKLRNLVPKDYIGLVFRLSDLLYQEIEESRQI
jgi:hypothetical protein